MFWLSDIPAQDEPHLCRFGSRRLSRNPDVIITVGDNNLTLDLKAATNTIPIVISNSVPVERDRHQLGATRGQYHWALCKCRAGAMGQAD